MKTLKTISLFELEKPIDEVIKLFQDLKEEFKDNHKEGSIVELILEHYTELPVLELIDFSLNDY